MTQSQDISYVSVNVLLPAPAKNVCPNLSFSSSSAMPPPPPPAQLMFAIAVDKASNCSGVMPPPEQAFTGRKDIYNVSYSLVRLAVRTWPFFRITPGIASMLLA